MGTAKPVSLSVRPFQVSHLCYELDGIVELSNAQLGNTVAAFDFPAFYAILGSAPTVTGDPSLLLYNFLEIDAAVAPFALVALRKEARKAALSKAIYGRQNAYFAKYGNSAAIIAQMNQYYSPSIIGSKPNRLAILSALAEDQFNDLKSAYTSDGRLGVVKTTGSVLQSLTESIDSSNESTSDVSSDVNIGTAVEEGQSNDESIGLGPISGTVPLPPGDGAPFAGWKWTTYAPPDVDLEMGSNQETTTSTATEIGTSAGSAQSQSYGSASETQTIVNTDYGYRTPYFESAAQFERAQISLMDQQFAQFMYGQNLPNLAQVFQNELNAIDGDVFRLQLAYLNSILLSPIAGTITGVYKNPGDAVKAGEPVVRVENNSTIYLLATVIYRGPITIGSTVTVTTNLFDSASLPTDLSGSVVSVRGHREDDQWELVVKCDNLNSSSEPIFPLGYHFDYDDTTVSIT